jgi:hypothetical protein
MHLARISSARLHWLLPSRGMLSRSMMKLARRDCHGRRDVGSGDDELVLVICEWEQHLRKLGRQYRRRSKFYLSGWKSKVCPQLVVPDNSLVECIILGRGDFSSWWEPKIFDQPITTLVHYSLLGGIDFGETRLMVLPWWCYLCCYKK